MHTCTYHHDRLFACEKNSELTTSITYIYPIPYPTNPTFYTHDAHRWFVCEKNSELTRTLLLKKRNFLARWGNHNPNPNPTPSPNLEP